ncbi:uncharacterized protein METZ01_LOCUS320662, partial [marine metagenome]
MSESKKYNFAQKIKDINNSKIII